jgi:dUTP pyrophosphatase
MNRIGIAQFEKVSFSQWKNDLLSGDLKDMYSRFPDIQLKKVYDSIKLPKRSTFLSAGYDFFLPVPILDIPANSAITIPTGIRCKMDEGWVLKIYPRSGHGFKFGVRLANSVGIIDGDYVYADNEGHIQVKLVNDSILKKHIELNQGDAFCQGVFVPYGITVDDDKDEKEVRKNGFGSTDRK